MKDEYTTNSHYITYMYFLNLGVKGLNCTKRSRTGLCGSPPLYPSPFPLPISPFPLPPSAVPPFPFPLSLSAFPPPPSPHGQATPCWSAKKTNTYSLHERTNRFRHELSLPKVTLGSSMKAWFTDVRPSNSGIVTERPGTILLICTSEKINSSDESVTDWNTVLWLLAVQFENIYRCRGSLCSNKWSVHSLKGFPPKKLSNYCGNLQVYYIQHKWISDYQVLFTS